MDTRRLPKNLKPAKTQPVASTQAVRRDDDTGPVFFYMPKEKYGFMCQWDASTFYVPKSEISALVRSESINDTTDAVPFTAQNEPQPNDDELLMFTCAEQFMMYCKAARFDDTATQARILASGSPKTHKALGRAVNGFDAASWDEIKDAVVVAGNMAKFGQKEGIRKKLLATGDRALVEASAKDRVWGIGFRADVALERRADWGENRLGRALEVVRGQLRDREQREVEGNGEEEEVELGGV